MASYITFEYRGRSYTIRPVAEMYDVSIEGVRLGRYQTEQQAREAAEFVIREEAGE